jgi:enoyl-CoA hydratase/carnithine racemase
MGIVNRVVPDGELEAEVSRLAAQFAAKSATVVGMGRATFIRQIDLDYRRSLANAVEDFCNVAMSDEAQEGLRAFAEKRPPKW